MTMNKVHLKSWTDFNMFSMIVFPHRIEGACKFKIHWDTRAQQLNPTSFRCVVVIYGCEWCCVMIQAETKKTKAAEKKAKDNAKKEKEAAKKAKAAAKASKGSSAKKAKTTPGVEKKATKVASGKKAATKTDTPAKTKKTAAKPSAAKEPPSTGKKRKAAEVEEKPTAKVASALVFLLMGHQYGNDLRTSICGDMNGRCWSLTSLNIPKCVCQWSSLQHIQSNFEVMKS